MLQVPSTPISVLRLAWSMSIVTRTIYKFVVINGRNSQLSTRCNISQNYFTILLGWIKTCSFAWDWVWRAGGPHQQEKYPSSQHACKKWTQHRETILVQSHALESRCPKTDPPKFPLAKAWKCVYSSLFYSCTNARLNKCYLQMKLINAEEKIQGNLLANFARIAIKEILSAPCCCNTWKTTT